MQRCLMSAAPAWVVAVVVTLFAASRSRAQYPAPCYSPPLVTLGAPVPGGIPFAGSSYALSSPGYSFSTPSYTPSFYPPPLVAPRYAPRYINPGPYYYTPAYSYTPGYYSYYYTPGYFRY
jgi:hypothetical protein